MSVALNYSPEFYKIFRSDKVVGEKVRGLKHKTSIEFGIKTNVQVGDRIESLVDHNQYEAVEITTRNTSQGRPDCYLVYVSLLQ